MNFRVTGPERGPTWNRISDSSVTNCGDNPGFQEEDTMTTVAPYDPNDGVVDPRATLAELKAHWLPLFKRLDDGKSGKSYPSINLRDLKRHHRPQESRIPISVLEKLFFAADDDRDGVLEYKEFAKWCIEEEMGKPDEEDEPDVTLGEVGQFREILKNEVREEEEEERNESAMERGQSKPKPYAQPRPPQRGSNHTMETIEETVQDKDAPFDPDDGKVDTKGVLKELESHWKPLFERFDDGKSGKTYPAIRLCDLKKHMKAAETSIPLPVVEKLFLAADDDLDGILEYQEFAKWCLEEEMGIPDEEGEPDVTMKDVGQFRRFLTSNIRSIVPRSVKEEEDYDDNYSCRPPPLFMILVSVVEVAVFIYYGDLLGNVGASSPIPTCSPLIYHPWRRYEAWRFFTYMLLHAGLVHLIFNLLIQLILGVPLEMVHRWWRVGLIYFLGVIAGSMANSLADNNSYLLGASGGVYAIIWAHLANIILNYKEMEYGPVRIAVLSVLTVADLTYALYERFGGSKAEGETTVGVAAHIGGGLAGCLVGIFVLRNIKRHLWEDRIWWAALALYLGLMIFGVFWNIFGTSFPKTEWKPLLNISYDSVGNSSVC